MSKGLEALEIIGKINLGKNPYVNFDEDKLKNCMDEEYKTIEKELKALEIIKNKWVDVGFLMIDIFHEYKTKESYNDSLYEQFQLTQEEYDLLKEVLENER